MRLDLNIISCIILPIAGYYAMITTRNRATLAIQKKMFDYGMYRFKPVYGDDVTAVAHGYKRSGVIIFVFTIILPLSMLLLKYLH